MLYHAYLLALHHLRNGNWINIPKLSGFACAQALNVVCAFWHQDINVCILTTFFQTLSHVLRILQSISHIIVDAQYAVLMDRCGNLL